MSESERTTDGASWAAEPEHDRTLETNWLFELRRERFRSRASGRSHDYFVLHLADVVNVVAVTADDELLLVRQFRAGSRRDSLETPGGLVERGEDPAEAAARELLEETGYAGDPPRLLGTMWTNSSLLTSRASVVLITGLRRVASPRLDASEELVIERVPVSSAGGLIRSGAVDHSLSVAALLWWLSAGDGGPLAP
jgi:8-oxo-dGTP pyrophosphatase MutT (NUDIX family)